MNFDSKEVICEGCGNKYLLTQKQIEACTESQAQCAHCGEYLFKKKKDIFKPLFFFTLWSASWALTVGASNTEAIPSGLRLIGFVMGEIAIALIIMFIYKRS